MSLFTNKLPMLHLIRITLVFILIYIGLVLVNPELAPDFIPKMNRSYQIDGWIIFGRDKLGHFFLIGFAALALNFLLWAKRINIFGFSLLLGSVIIAVLVTLEELRQVPLTNRHFEMFDIFYNFAGILIFGRLGAWLVKKIE